MAVSRGLHERVQMYSSRNRPAFLEHEIGAGLDQLCHPNHQPLTLAHLTPLKPPVSGVGGWRLHRTLTMAHFDAVSVIEGS